MLRDHSVLIVFFALGFSPVALAADVVLTAFEPFNGASENASIAVVADLGDLLVQNGFSAKTCVLPVVYEKGSAAALDCLREASVDGTPRLMLSLGEGFCGRIEFEIRARNLIHSGTPDNEGNVRLNQKIDETGPEFESFTAPMQSFLSAAENVLASSPSQNLEAVLSNDAGSFVCNDASYRVQSAFRKDDLPVPYGFIHIPPAYCRTNSGTSEKLVQAIGAGILDYLE